LETEGYDLGGSVPESPEALFELIQKRGKTLGQWAIGSYEQFLQEAEPEFIPAATYANWFKKALSEKRQKETIELWGPIPGKQMVAEHDGLPHLAVSRIQLGNVVIMPQPTVGGGGEDEGEVKTIHGTDQAAPHFYLGAYLWAQHGFDADAIIHLGTHGSLEFTYGKSACLSRDCWPDILIGEVPHIYPYIINNVGEALVAKRRSYGVTVSHLTPPFTESGLYGDLSMLHEKLHVFETETDPLLKRETRKTITRMVRELDLAKDVDLPEDTGAERPLTDEEIVKIDRLIHEMHSKTITDGLHVLGRPYSDQQIASTAMLMLGEPSYETLLEVTGHADNEELQEWRHNLARPLVEGVLAGEITAEHFFPETELAALRLAREKAEEPETTGPMGGAMARVDGENKREAVATVDKRNDSANDAIKRAKDAGLPHSVLCGCSTCTAWVKENPKLAKAALEAETPAKATRTDSQTTSTHQHVDRADDKHGDHDHRDHEHGDHEHGDHDHRDHDHPHEHSHAHDGHAHAGHIHETPVDLNTFWGANARSRPKINGDEEFKLAFLQVLDDIQQYADGLRNSPKLELDRIAVALSGGYVPPSSGGDALFNPQAVPTGRNLYSINAEHTPSEEAWRVGKLLAGQIVARHKAQTGQWPKQVAFTLWGSEFIRGKGTTLAEIMYLIGVRPVRNSRGTVYDVELIPAEELGRPRIDVLVQTSGQFRDAGASRIALLDTAITMVAELPDESIPNFVRDGTAATEQELKKLGFAPKEARELSTARIFGSAANQSYGTGIMGMVEKGDTWEDESQIANRYMRNMGGIYRDEKTWGTFKEGLLGAAMQGTEVVVQPRSSNTWGPLSLDHVYEFMGGMTASIRNKTGNDPVGYFSDLRTRGRPQSTTAVAAIREDARTTLWNPKYLRGMQNEGPGAAADLTETVRNMYGWNVMQPSAIDEEMWDETYRVFVDDKHQLAMREYFEEKNPYALQDMTSVMLETARKGYWAPSEEVLQKLAQLHAELVAKFGAACSYETCGNRKLQEFLNAKLVAPGSEIAADVLDAYAASLAAVLESAQPMPEVEGIELEEKTEVVENEQPAIQPVQTMALAGCIVLLVVGTLLVGGRRTKKSNHLGGV
ncbi:MAG: cobaltochelatase subunit CobN, partial [Pirellulaceae bacterium]|nr:cobaltochelatase subunit CobN [Pirellulaceae bacterium]